MLLKLLRPKKKPRYRSKTIPESVIICLIGSLKKPVEPNNRGQKILNENSHFAIFDCFRKNRKNNVQF